MAEKERMMVHKHLYIFVDQVENLNELRRKTGGINISKIIRRALDQFLKLSKDKQRKIIGEE